MLALYHWEPTVNSGEPLICLAEKGLAFEDHYVDLLAFEQHAPAFLALNPQGQVPVLVHDGRVVTETAFLLQYLDDVFPAVRLTPERARDRYSMNVWAKYGSEHLAPAIWQLGWHRFMVPALRERDLGAAREGLGRLPPERRAVWQQALDDCFTDEALAAARTSLAVRVERLEAALAEAPWLAGEHYSLADIMIFPAARTLPVLVPGLVGPRLADWLARVGERPAVRQALATARSARPESMFAPGPEGSPWG